MDSDLVGDTDVPTSTPQSQRPGEIDPRFADAMNDPKLRAKSTDPGWKYSFWQNVGDKNKVKCALCGHVSSGGIKRLKEHLIGGFRDCIKCPKTTTTIAKELLDYKNRNKKRKVDLDYQYSQNESNTPNVVNEGDVVVVPSSTQRSRTTSSSANRPPVCKYPSGKGPMDSFTTPSPWDVVAQRKANRSASQTTIGDTYKKEATQVAYDCISQWFYEAGIPFNAANRNSFDVMFEAVIQAGKGFIPPSYHQLRLPLLERQFERCKEMQVVHEKHWRSYGCTIMCDGWTDKRQRSLVNFLVNTPEGSFFIYAKDATSDEHTGELLFNLIDEVVEKVGEENVVQVVTDNAANMVLAGKMLTEKRKKLFWTPCAAHCLDLMLEDISKLDIFSGVLTRARKVTTFIYQHTRLHDAFVKGSDNHQELVRSGVTRFATHFLALSSLLKHRPSLTKLFVSDIWTNSSWAKTTDGDLIFNTVMAKSFWEKVENYLRATQPLVVVLRLVDADEKPPMGYVGRAFEMAKEKIIENFGQREKEYKPILDILDYRWGK